VKAGGISIFIISLAKTIQTVEEGRVWLVKGYLLGYFGALPTNLLAVLSIFITKK